MNSMNHTNQTAEDLFSCYSPSVVGYRYVAVIWGCFVTISGTIGNLMTILAFARDPHLRTRFNALIVNLAAADLLYCTVLQPITVDSSLHLRWRGGQLWCTTFGLLFFLSNSVSIITLCLVAMGRYLLVAQRAAFDRVFSRRGLPVLLVSSWALGLASFGPLWPVYVFVPQFCTCSLHRTRGRPYTTILLFCYLCVGLGCVGVFYLLIYRRVRVASRALLRHRPSRMSSRRKPASSAQVTDDSGVQSGATATDACSCKTSSDADPPRDDVRSSARAPESSVAVPASPAADTRAEGAAPAKGVGESDVKHVTRMCFAVFLCFVLCFVPFLLLNMADRHSRAPQVLHMFSANLTSLNSCVNPLLYAVMNRQFRLAYGALLRGVAAPFTCLWARCRARTA